MTYQHFIGVINAEGTDIAVFVPAGSVVGRHLWPIGFKALLEDAPDAPTLNVTTVEQPARLTRGLGDGEKYHVTQRMRLRLLS